MGRRSRADDVERLQLQALRLARINSILSGAVPAAIAAVGLVELSRGALVWGVVQLASACAAIAVSAYFARRDRERDARVAAEFARLYDLLDRVERLEQRIADERGDEPPSDDRPA